MPDVSGGGCVAWWVAVVVEELEAEEEAEAAAAAAAFGVPGICVTSSLVPWGGVVSVPDMSRT